MCRRVKTAVAVAALVTAGCLKASALEKAPATKPHLIMMLQDDLGYFDNAFMGNTEREGITANVSRLAREGIILKSHYVFYWCSPTRRSFLTGRLPIHHGQMLSGITDDIDLRWNIISQKLEPAGYKCHWYGKGHTGYLSMAHLPTSRGFLNFTGFLGGAQSYTSNQRWKNEAPLNSTEYSSELYGDAILTTLNAHDPQDPLFLYIPWQAVHSPYMAPAFWPSDKPVYEGMLYDTDVYTGQIRTLLESKGMYDNLLWVYSADNGGRGDGINYPLRGEKRTNYEGGMRVSAFVSGGLIPPALRGTQNSIRFHIVDFYATFCHLAGVDYHDDSPTPPLPIDPSDPSKDIYGNTSWPGVDGVVIWDMLLNPANYNTSSAHPTLVLSSEVLIQGDVKLLTSQRGDTRQGSDSTENTWQHPDGSWFFPSGWTQTCGFPVYSQKGSVIRPFKPCIFNLSTDLNETTDIAPQNPELLQTLWTALNNSWLGYYHARSPAHLVGPCNPSCTAAKWGAIGPGDGPECGVPGCDTPAPPGPPPPPPGPNPVPHKFPTVNSTNCTFVQGAHYVHRTPDHLHGPAGFVDTEEECCRLCFEDTYCVASAWHEGPQGACFTHFSVVGAEHNQPGVVGCVTGRHV